MWGSIKIHSNSAIYNNDAILIQMHSGSYSASRGFTLIELMVVVAVVAILAAIATPYYSDYIQRGKLSKGMSTLSHLAVQMEKSYLDYHNYGLNGVCRVPATNDDYFSYSCNTNGKSYTWIATANFGSYKYSINQNGVRATLEFAGSGSSPDCWMLSNGGGCY